MADVEVLDDYAAMWRLTKKEATVEPRQGDRFAIHIKNGPEKEYVVRRVIVRPDGYIVLCRVEDDEPRDSMRDTAERET